jgi:histone H2A
MASQKKSRAPAAKKAAKSSLTFPTGRVGSLLRKGRYARRVSKTAAVYLTSVLGYLTAELLDLTSKSLKKGTTRLTPRAVTLAVRADDELGSLLKNVTFSRGGVVPKVHEALEKKAKKAGKKSKKVAKK